MRIYALFLLGWAGMFSTALAAPALYSTGPGEASAYIRFVNLTSQPVSLGAAEQVLEGMQASDFQTVTSGKALGGVIRSGEQSLLLQDSLPEGAFLTVAIVESQGSLSMNRFLDEVSDFSAKRSSVSLYHAAPDCGLADVKVQGRDLRLVQGVAYGQVMRRQFNPAELNLEVVCAEQTSPIPVPSQGMLEPGERYSILLYQNAEGKRSVQWIKDTMQK